MNARMVLLALVLFTSRVEAGAIDKPRLRKLAVVPTVSVTASIGFSTTYGFYFNREKPNPAMEIGRLRKQLKGDAGDAERYQRLSLLYAKAEREKESDEASAKAMALCRQQVREHPHDMRWLAQLGDALVEDGQTDEGGKLLRRAVKEAPNEWHAWLALACYVDRLSRRAVMGGKPFTFRYVNQKLMIPALLKNKPTEKQIADMRRLYQEAAAGYDRAVALAPRETKPYWWRAASHALHGTVEAGLQMSRGEKVQLMTKIFTPEIAADLRQIARLSPEDPASIGVAITVEIMACILHEKMKSSGPEDLFAGLLGKKNRSLVESLPAPSQKFVRWAMNRLEELGKGTDKGKAAAACEMLAGALLMLDTRGKGHDRLSLPFDRNDDEDKTMAKVLQFLRRAVELDPARDWSWDLLTMILAEQKKTAEALAVARKRIDGKDNAHNRFLLAKVFADKEQFDSATEQLRAGLKCDPRDLDCCLGLSAMLLKRDDAKALTEAGERLDAAKDRMTEMKDKSHRKNYLLLHGIQAALNDHPDRAKEIFEQILQHDKGDESAARAWAALGIPFGPAQERMAMDYLRKRGRIQRDDKRPGSPVVEAKLSEDVTDDDLVFLTAFPQLRKLELSRSSITDAGLVHLKRLTNLRELEFKYVKITNKGLMQLKPLTKLRVLRLGNTKINDEGLAYLDAFQELEELTIDNIFSVAHITPAGLAHLRKLPKLQNISLNIFFLTNMGLAHLTAIPHLQKLSIPYSSITDGGMSQLARCTELQELSLPHTKITDAGLIHLKGLTRLKILDLSETAITDAGLVHLRGLTHLRELKLNNYTSPFSTKKNHNTHITDAGLKHLQKLTQLTGLDLKECSITDAGLVHLHRLKRLEYVYLNGTKVTPQGIAELKKVFPKLALSRIETIFKDYRP